MTIQLLLLISIVSVIVLLMLLAMALNFTRNFFTRSRYVRVETYNDDKSVRVKYYKKVNFNKDGSYLLNPDHVFNLKGYSTIVLTQHTQENINPLDFESKYDAVKYKTGIQNKLIESTFSTLKTNKLDTLQMVLIANLMTLLLVAYLTLKYMGVI